MLDEVKCSLIFVSGKKAILLHERYAFLAVKSHASDLLQPDGCILSCFINILD